MYTLPSHSITCSTTDDHHYQHLLNDIALWCGTLVVPVQCQCRILYLLNQIAQTDGNNAIVRQLFEEIRVFFCNYNKLRNALELKVKEFIEECGTDFKRLSAYKTSLHDTAFLQRLLRNTNLTNSIVESIESMDFQCAGGESYHTTAPSHQLCFQTLKGGLSKKSFMALPTVRFAFAFGHKNDMDGADTPTGNDVDSLMNDSGDEHVVDGDTSNDDLICSICLCGYEAWDRVTFLPCNHYFHTECTRGWFPTNVSCPMCRYKVNL